MVRHRNKYHENIEEGADATFSKKRHLGDKAGEEDELAADGAAEDTAGSGHVKQKKGRYDVKQSVGAPCIDKCARPADEPDAGRMDTGAPAAKREKKADATKEIEIDADVMKEGRPLAASKTETAGKSEIASGESWSDAAKAAENIALMNMIKTMKQERAQLETRMLNMERENTALKAEKNTANQEMARLDTLILNIVMENTDLRAEIHLSNQEKAQLETRVLNMEDMEQENMGLKEENHTLLKDKEEVEQEKARVEQELHMEQARNLELEEELYHERKNFGGPARAAGG